MIDSVSTIRLVGFALLAVGGFICIVNFYLSFLRYAVYWLRGRQAEYRFVSGCPAIGSALVVASLFLFREPIWVVALGAVIAVFDTGGIHWFIGTLTFMSVRESVRRNRH